MSSFLFLTDEWPDLAEPAKRAEALALTDPRASCFYACRALEQAIGWMYENDTALLTPYEDTLSARLGIMYRTLVYILTGAIDYVRIAGRPDQDY